MCSSQPPAIEATVSALARAASRLGPNELAELVDGVLDQLLDADLTQLSTEQHEVLVARLVRTEHRQHAAVLRAVAAFDTADVASVSRHRTTRRWLEHRTKLSAGTAGHLTRTARALRDHLPDTERALAQGSISPQHVSAISAVVTKVGIEHAVSAEPILLELAECSEPSVVRRATAQIHALVDPEGAENALHQAYDRRGVTLSVVGDRAYLDGVLDTESAELLRAALQPLMTRAGEGDRRSTPQLRADALLDLAKRQLDSGTLPELGGERPHVSVVIDEEALRTNVGAVTLPWTGVAVPADVIRRWACDAQLTPVLAALLPAPKTEQHGPSSRAAVMIGGGWLPLDVGRASRLATTGQLKALRVRDGGCVHPGCSRTSAYCDAHHVQHWADGGPTSTDNMVLLCRHHHRTLHAGQWSLSPDSARAGRFWASTSGWAQPAQSAADRSPAVLRSPDHWSPPRL